ncbi:MAG: hypothetical protein IJE58_08895, partial [Oscillospiraceae bacterium]|nr:hypothetical protein [Oscillospiraceae bacterium]
EPEKKTAAEPKTGRKLDGFFYTCMAGVAAVSVAATLLIGSMTGGSTPAPGSPDGGVSGETVSESLQELERENAELRAKVEQQKMQILDLQNDLMTLMGSEEYLSTMTTDPDESNEVLDAQLKALDTLAQIQDAYANNDLETLEALIPEMDAQLKYLTPDALNNYYLILEYMEQPSNG